MTKQEFSLFWKVWFSPKKYIPKIFKLDWSYKKIFMWLVALAIAMEIIAFINYIFQSDWYLQIATSHNNDIKVVSLQELKNFTFNTIRNVFHFYFMAFIANVLIKVSSKRDKYRKILLVVISISLLGILLMISEVIMSLLTVININISYNIAHAIIVIRMLVEMFVTGYIIKSIINWSLWKVILGIIVIWSTTMIGVYFFEDLLKMIGKFIPV